MEDETSEGKLAIGIGVLVVTAAVVIVCPAVLGAAAATVTQFIATSALVGSAISGIMNGAASVKAGKSFFDGFASGVEEGAIIGTATYIYHGNKYDKAITGGDVVKTWVKSAATSFAMQSVGGGKPSSKTDGGNGVISTGKGRGEPEGSFKCKTSYGKSSGKYDTTADFLTNIENRNGKFYTDKATIDKIGQVEARGEDFSLLNKRIMSSRASIEGGTSVVYKYSDELGTKYLIHEVTDARGYIIHRDFDAVRISSGQLINKGH